MFQLKILRKFLLPGAVYVAPTLAAGEEKATSDINKPVEEISKTETCEHCHNTPSKLRPSDLPLYGGEQEKRGRVKNVVADPSELEQTIGAVRKEVWVFYDQYKGYQQKVVEVVDVGKAHAESTLGFLREEATSVHRAGAIGLGGLAGLVMGLRSGVFKRTFYATAGAAAITALCYPREAAEIADETLQISKYYFIIAYNFICGVNPDGFKFLSSSAVHSNKPSAEGSTASVPDKTALPVDKEKPLPSAPVSQTSRDQSNPADSRR